MMPRTDRSSRKHSFGEAQSRRRGQWRTSSDQRLRNFRKSLSSRKSNQWAKSRSSHRRVMSTQPPGLAPRSNARTIWTRSSAANNPSVRGDLRIPVRRHDNGFQSFRGIRDFLVLAISSASFFSSGKASLYSLDRTLLRRFPNA
jgi:hypothetical protein